MPVTLRPRRGLLPLVLTIPFAVSGCESALVSSAANAFGARLPALAMTEDEERQLGEQSYREIVAQSQPTSHPEYQAVVERVGRRLAHVADRKDFAWEFRVLAGPTQNAFCLPGGKVAIYEGLLPLCENEAGLAVVMSHEIAHAIARHGGERMRNEALAEAVGQVVSDASKDQSDERKLMIQGGYGAAAQLGAILPFSRKHESEADSIGLLLMAKAGYDPAEAPKFWRRFSQASTGTMPEIFSTHPADERRAADLEDLLPKAETFYGTVAQKFGTGEKIPNLGLTANQVQVIATQEPPKESPSAKSFLPAALAPQKSEEVASDDPFLTSDPTSPADAPPIESAAFEMPATAADGESGPVSRETLKPDDGWTPARK